jgi:hypothetical protein
MIRPENWPPAVRALASRIEGGDDTARLELRKFACSADHLEQLGALQAFIVHASDAVKLRARTAVADLMLAQPPEAPSSRTPVLALAAALASADVEGAMGALTDPERKCAGAEAERTLTLLLGSGAGEVLDDTDPANAAPRALVHALVVLFVRKVDAASLPAESPAA